MTAAPPKTVPDTSKNAPKIDTSAPHVDAHDIAARELITIWNHYAGNNEYGHLQDSLAAALLRAEADGAKAEREECARLAGARARGTDKGINRAAKAEARSIMLAIRARSNEMSNG